MRNLEEKELKRSGSAARRREVVVSPVAAEKKKEMATAEGLEMRCTFETRAGDLHAPEKYDDTQIGEAN